ncbi:membrane protein [Myceligenerans cantabricum]
MTWSEIASWSLVAAAAVVAWAAWRVASRLDRLHRKVTGSRGALDAQLVRRAWAAVDLASSGGMDPASALVVADAAYVALDDAGPGETGARPLTMDGLPGAREDAESNLSAVLREALGGAAEVAELWDGPAAEQAAALAAAWYRATLARRFHNEAVAQARRMRRRWYVRAAYLAGRAPVPRTVELDDRMPEGLDRGVGPAA